MKTSDFLSMRLDFLRSHTPVSGALSSQSFRPEDNGPVDNARKLPKFDSFGLSTDYNGFCHAYQHYHCAIVAVLENRAKEDINHDRYLHCSTERIHREYILIGSMCDGICIQILNFGTSVFGSKYSYTNRSWTISTVTNDFFSTDCQIRFRRWVIYWTSSSFLICDGLSDGLSRNNKTVHSLPTKQGSYLNLLMWPQLEILFSFIYQTFYFC